MTKLRINGKERSVQAAPDTPLLWILRDNLDMTGTKFGCGAGVCGACTVHIDGEATRSCQVPLSDLEDSDIVTIEGLAKRSGGELTKVQVSWIAEQVPQCGYCQSGVIMAVSALLEKYAKPTDEQIDAEITNICRCGTYPRIRAAIHRAAEMA